MARTDWRKYGVEPIPESEAKRMRARNRPGVAKDPRTRQFRDIQTGEVLSRRQVENRRVIDTGGWDSWSQWQRITSPTARETRQYKQYQEFARGAVADGKYGSRAQVRKADSEFNQAYNEWRKSGYERGSRAEDTFRSDPRNRPGGPYAKFLEETGRRPENAKYPVGATPKRKRRR